jgi:chemotaxis protein MotB
MQKTSRRKTKRKNRFLNMAKKKKHEEHENAERWLLTYSDMITLLMVFFIMMYAMSMLDMAKFDKAKSGFQQAFRGIGTPGVLPGGKSVFGSGGNNPEIPTAALVFENFVKPETEADKEKTDAVQPLTQPEEETGKSIVGEVDMKNLSTEEALEITGADTELVFIAESILDSVKGTEDYNNVNLSLETRGLIIRIQSEGILFDSGVAEVRTEIMPLLDIIAESFKFYTGMIVIEGHTDNKPISTIAYPSNWELSTARASSVLKYWLDKGLVSAENVMAAGFADTQPMASNDTEESRAKNRRVEILVLNKDTSKLLLK